jgi:hypothetical protein
MYGRVADDGRVRFLDRPLEVGAEAAAMLGNPEAANKTLRCAAPCEGGRCAHWSGRCGVPDMVAKVALEHNRTLSAAALDCPIRSNCRWYEQQGLSACQICPSVARAGVIVHSDPG